MCLGKRFLFIYYFLLLNLKLFYKFNWILFSYKELELLRKGTITTDCNSACLHFRKQDLSKKAKIVFFPSRLKPQLK